MIFGNINQLDKSKLEYPNIIYQVLNNIRKLDFTKHQDGDMTIDGVLYKTFSTKTAPAEERISETHVENIDVQFVISGTESVKFQPLINNCPDESNIENDNYFYHNKTGQEQLLILNESDFAIFFPWDIHAPLCQINKPLEVRKIVAKVPLTLLNT